MHQIYNIIVVSFSTSNFLTIHFYDSGTATVLKSCVPAVLNFTVPLHTDIHITEVTEMTNLMYVCPCIVV